MSSFKVSTNERTYKNGMAEECVIQGRYAIDISVPPEHRTRQRCSVTVGDTLYMMGHDHYWVGTVTSDWTQMPMVQDDNNPCGLFYNVNHRRLSPVTSACDEWVCKVDWSERIPGPPKGSALRTWIQQGWNAVTIKRLSSPPPVE